VADRTRACEGCEGPVRTFPIGLFTGKLGAGLRTLRSLVSGQSNWTPLNPDLRVRGCLPRTAPSALSAGCPSSR